MDGDRAKKIEAGREKLAAYRKKKQKKDKQYPVKSPLHSSDSSSSNLSLSDLPGCSSNRDVEDISESSTISEHLQSNIDSIENDRSLQEIQISNSHLSLISFSNLPDDNEDYRLSQEQLTVDSSGKSERSDTIIADKVSDNIVNEVRNILSDILGGDRFVSRTGGDGSESMDTLSGEVSINIFEGVSLDDSSINNYIAKIRQEEEIHSIKDEDGHRIQELERELVRKNSEIAVLSAELDSLKELTNSLSTTDYKPYQEEYHNRIVEFQNAILHRDNLIQQLTESLQQSILNREELQQQSENFAKEISLLQKQLTESSRVIKRHKCSSMETPSKSAPTSPLRQSIVEEAGANQWGITEKNATLEGESILNLKEEWLKVTSSGGVNEILLNDLNAKINVYVEQKIAASNKRFEKDIKMLKEKVALDKGDYEAEIEKLRELLSNIKTGPIEFVELEKQLNAQHATEMEELRTYFERKCADLEKNYSEEVFSQQSRKMSGSSISEAELLNSECCLSRHPSGPGGDAPPDLAKMKVDDENKSHVELEMVKREYDNLTDQLKVEHDMELSKLRQSYQGQIDELKLELDRMLKNTQLSVTTAVQEVAISGEYELAEVVQSYERRLEEQVTLAKIDIISALEHQIQILADSDVDSEWPAELLQIRNAFTDKYVKQMEAMKVEHDREMLQLKEEHYKVLNGALERARRRSIREGDNDIEILKDRDNLKKTNSVLRHLLGELLVFFTKCEDELNKSLVDEILKYGFDKDLTQIENELNDSVDSSASTSMITKRVHFTPNFSDFINIVDAASAASLDSKDLSFDLKNELGSCLERLKSDANAILALTTTGASHNRPDVSTGNDATVEKNVALEEKISSLTRQMIADSQIRSDLAVELEEVKNYVRNLESERVSLENHLEELIDKQKVLERDLLEANKKIGDLIECGHKEVVSEGYGQDHRYSSLGGKIANLAELQEKARTLVAEWKSGADHPLIQLVEELCREGERITEEANRDKEDLRQQVEEPISSCGAKIEAADRKLRATCCFLEEQAAEREMERDESQREIAALKEQLRERDKDKEAYDLVTKEVEQLETQMREMTKLIEASEQKREEVENERKEAVDKIWVLRDIIRDLECQVETKTEVETELKRIITELEEVIKHQTKNVDDLSRELEAVKGDGDTQLLKERIIHLESEAQKLRLNSELVGGEGALKEIQIQLNQIEALIDKKTKVLEGLHTAISSTSCSSPSEDMSIRDQIRPQTPGALEECDVPLQQLARLKEKLVKHSRAEDAAVKRIRDLEMQLANMKQELEETQNEKDILQNQVTEQIVLLSSLQMRLDEQRLKAEQNQRQANSSLEVRIYDLENEAQALKETIHCKEKTIKQLNKVVEQTKERLEDRERELGAKEQDESAMRIQKEIERLAEENRLLKGKIDSDAQNAQILPNLVDNIIADKNADIEKLRERLSDVEKHYDEYRSLNLDLEQLKQLSAMVTSDRTLPDILSLLNLSGTVEQVRKAAPSSEIESLGSPVGLMYNRNVNETALMGVHKEFFNPEISSIDREGSLNVVNFTTDAVLIKPNSTEKSLERKVHFEDVDFQGQLREKDAIIGEYAEKLKILVDLERDIETLRENLESTERALNAATRENEEQRKAFEKVEKDLRIELAENKMHLTEKEGQLNLAEEDNRRIDLMCVSLAGEKKEAQSESEELRRGLQRLEFALEEKNAEILRLEEQMGKLIESCVMLEELQERIKNKEGELELVKGRCADLEQKLTKKVTECETIRSEHGHVFEDNLKLTKELKNKSEQVDSLTRELAKLVKSESENEQETEEIKRLKALLVDRECELEILNEDITRYQNEMAKLEQDLRVERARSVDDDDVDDAQMQFMKLQKVVAERDLEILKLRTVRDDLSKEIQRLQDHLQEKDRVIEQMKADTRSLHVNLETIQNKIQETGNIVDLRKRLQEEQHLNAVLREEIRALKINLECGDRKERSVSIEDIAGQVRKQLDYSAHLDSNILQALSSGDELNDGGANAIGEDRHREWVELETLKREVQILEEKLEAEREQTNRLRNQLDKEKKTSASVQIQDANLLEQMRIRLEEALDGEKEYEKCLERERKRRVDLENQVIVLKQKTSNVSTSSNSKTEATEYKSLPCMETAEMARLREDVRRLSDENEQLTSDLKTMKRAKNEANANLRYAKDMLELKLGEVEKLDGKLGEAKRNESVAKEELVRCKTELEQKLREIENSRQLMCDLERERYDMKTRIRALSNRMEEMEEEKKINKLAERHKEVDLSATVPQKLLDKMKELTNSLKDQMEENKITMETLNKMTVERSKLLDRIRMLEERNTYKVPFDDPVARANHLFGKYLRSESYRKALVWQKRYLIALLATYQDFRPIAEALPLSTFERKDHRRPPAPIKKSGKQRFKCGAIVVIAIVRMKYMVQRWHSGKRVAAYSQYPSRTKHVTNGADPPLNCAGNQPPTRFHLGQPVSSQNFFSFGRTNPTVSGSPPSVHLVGDGGDNPRAHGNSEDLARQHWSGATPPQKERLVANSIGVAAVNQNEFLAPLETPHVLTYFKRFNEIQQRLGMTLDNLNS